MTKAAAHLASLHECGHVVAILRYGGTIESIEIKERDCPECPTGKALGVVRYSLPIETRRDAFQELIVRYAGGIAVRRVYPRCTGDSVGDEQQADALLAQWFPDTRGRDQVKARARILAEQIVTEEWPRITGLALVLMNWRTMTGEQLAAVLPSYK
ncbi:MAG TPA: hypothetical protein VJ063_15910 [Verrucomicrobiae bacterium]|nr:hypothetical protein [Verrucomicrobiae bacterium]